MLAVPEQLKRPLREHPVTRGPYFGAARLALRMRIFFHMVLVGRYYTAEYFERLFARQLDPWGYVGDPISEERRARILAILPGASYERMLEIGCAEGWLTACLARRAQAMFGLDISEVALRRARERCAVAGNVRFARVDVLNCAVVGSFDGIVCAGILVYLPRAEQERVRDHLAGLLSPGGTLLLEHTREASPGEVAGRTIHAMYRKHPALELAANEERDCYAITVFRKRA